MTKKNVLKIVNIQETSITQAERVYKENLRPQFRSDLHLKPHQQTNNQKVSFEDIFRLWEFVKKTVV